MLRAADISVKNREEFFKLCTEFGVIFSPISVDIGYKHLLKMHINVAGLLPLAKG